MMHSVLFAVFQPDSEEAQRLLDEEFQRPEYVAAEPTLAQKAWNWVSEKFAELFSGVARASAEAGWPAWIVIPVIVLVLVLLFLWIRPGKIGKARTSGDSDLLDFHVTAEQYLQSAQESLARQQFSDAYLAAFRSLLRDADDRAIITISRSTTATLAMRDLAPAFPQYSQQLYAVTEQFNLIIYGGGLATENQVRDFMALVQQVKNTAPVYREDNEFGVAQDPARLVPR